MREAIEEDESFERELPKVTAFPANPREDVREVELVSSVVAGKTVNQPKRQPQVRKMRRVETSQHKKKTTKKKQRTPQYGQADPGRFRPGYAQPQRRCGLFGRRRCGGGY
jgi:hypothetical protein